MGGYTFENIQNVNNISITSSDNGPSILDIAFLQDLTEDSHRFRKAEKIAIAFGNEDFRNVLRKSGIMLRMLLSVERKELREGLLLRIRGIRPWAFSRNKAQVENWVLL